MFQVFRRYFAEKMTPLTRYMHYSILFLVLFQILISNFMDVSYDGVIGQNMVEYYSTWLHIILGLYLTIIAIIFAINELIKHGFTYFYPYLSGDIAQLTADIKSLMLFKFPDLLPKGLMAIIQGLGIGALLLVTLSGAVWYALWFYDLALLKTVKDIHELLTGLIEAYVVGHGGMGLIHIFLAYQEQKEQDQFSKG